jgi:hypothetical protein
MYWSGEAKMRDEIDVSQYLSPLFLFHTISRYGQLFNPVTSEIVLEFPPQGYARHGYPVMTDSRLSQQFSLYLYSLVTEHILFSGQGDDDLACIYDDSDEDVEEGDDDFSDFSTVMLRAPLELQGLPDYYDTIGFSFLDGQLYSPMYCEVIELQD